MGKTLSQKVRLKRLPILHQPVEASSAVDIHVTIIARCYRMNAFLTWYCVRAARAERIAQIAVVRILGSTILESPMPSLSLTRGTFLGSPKGRKQGLKRSVGAEVV